MAKKFICSNCGNQGPGTAHTRGSIFIEIILWLCFLIPGFIYSIWRLTTRTSVCKVCKSHDLVPLDTPRGRKLAQEYS